MKQEYEVVRIQEMDFGCEGLPEGAEVKVYVILRDTDGKEHKITHSDALLYERNINEGDKVYLIEGMLEKI